LQTTRNAFIIIFTLCFLYLLHLWIDSYLVLSIGLLLLGMFLFVLRFESRSIDARSIVLLAVLASIAAVVRIPFASIPSVQPTTFVIMMTGFVFGAESGLIVGVVGALAANMFLGQGPWTPWQMVAWGLVGFSAGLFRPVLNKKWAMIVFAIIWGFLFGWIMNLWGLLALYQSVNIFNTSIILSYFTGSLLFDLFHSLSNVIFILMFGELWIKILVRFKRKYGLLQ
jgi:energy-coupling factor transport system substrate-specific component